MSELIEKVARAMYPTWWETIDTCADGPDCDSCPLDRAHSLGKARAAILAVLEWYSDARNLTDRMADARITELNIDDVRATHKSAIAAAMRAELERLRGDK